MKGMEIVNLVGRAQYLFRHDSMDLSTCLIYFLLNVKSSNVGENIN